MLPKELSEDLCSLKPRVESLAQTVEIDFDRTGNRINAKFYPSVIISNDRMTYTCVRKILIDNDRHERKRYDYLLQDFELMGELCGILRNRRLERGSLDFDLPEPEVLLDMQGRPEAIIKAERNFAHMIIEELMIAANETVAEYLESHDVPGLYRIHEEPEASKMAEIVRIMNALEIGKRRKTLKVRELPDLIRQIHDLPQQEILNLIILRSMKQARYSVLNIGHL